MLKVGILGGGQLGRMMLQCAANYPVETYVLESDPDCPAAQLCSQFTKGDIRNYDDVLRFGSELDAITIEIESVNIDALDELEKMGVKVIPKPSALRILQNKIDQKEFYRTNQIPTSEFVITTSRSELEHQLSFLPGVHKLGAGGYDGRGIQIIEKQEDIPHGFDAPAVLEKKVDIKKEISMMIAVDQQGKIAKYQPVDMVFDPKLNLLLYQVCPARLPEKVLWRIEAIAFKAVRDLNSPGLFAVEFFINYDDHVLVNEIAPRVHNSGHHTIEAAYSSQFDMMWRILLGYPLGNPELILPAAIVNMVGEPGYTGPAFYEGLDDVLSMDNVFVHIYGKKQTRPGRKMGHVTIIANDERSLLFRANQIRHRLFVKTK